MISPLPKSDADAPISPPGVVGEIMEFDVQLAAILKQDAPVFMALPRFECGATEEALTAFNPQAKLFAKLDATEEALQADAAQLL